MNKQEFIKKVNKERRQNKNRFIFIAEIVEGSEIYMKNYNTWTQKYIVNGSVGSGIMDISVKNFNKQLETMLEDI